MKKEDFRQALRMRLMQIPAASRKTMTDYELLLWWNQIKQEDTYLTWERAPGDLWQHVQEMCRDLIGPSAVV